MFNIKKTISFLLVAALMLSSTLPAYAATYKYDRLGRLTEVTYSSGQTVSYTYDSMGNMTTVVNTHIHTKLAPVITTDAGALAPGVVGTDYSVTIMADNLPTAFEVLSGNLPEGLSINNDGVISGAPTTARTSNFSITALNEVGTSAPVAFSIEIITHSHNWDDGEEITPATCESEGEILYTCLHTGCTETETRTIPKLVHEPMFVETVEPTCRDSGYELYRCSNCGEEETRNEIDALGHNWDDGEEIAPATCEAEGGMLYTCLHIGCAETETRVIPKLVHELTLIETVEPTCTNNGYDLYRCSNCGEEESLNEI